MTGTKEYYDRRLKALADRYELKLRHLKEELALKNNQIIDLKKKLGEIKY